MSLFDKMSGKKKGILLAVIGFIGILLIIIGTVGEKRKEAANTENMSEKNQATLEYIEMLENKIKTITEQITGSDCVKVIVSISSGPVYIYVSNEELDENYSAKVYITVKTGETQMQLLNVQNGLGHDCFPPAFGSSRSRIPSPKRLNPTAVSKIAAPGNAQYHH